MPTLPGLSDESPQVTGEHSALSGAGGVEHP
jgi:hypothetical protein